MSWLKSVRATTAVIIVLGLTAGLFTGHIPAENYLQIALIVVGAYFTKRDSKEDRGEK